MAKVTKNAELVGDWRDDREAVVAALYRASPSARPDKVAMYADVFADYRAAQKNIEENGAVVLHPRTQAPIDNPFLKVREAARKTLLGLGLRCSALWEDV